jgi:NADH-quinone oxidoreductase subunit N
MIMAILPEIGLLVLGALVLFLDLVWKDAVRRSLGWVTAGGLALILVLTVSFSAPGTTPELMWGGMIRQDWLSFVFTLLFLFGAGLSALFAMDSEIIGRRGEFYLLLLASTMGMCLMASAADLVMLFLAIETTSIPLYALAGFLTRDAKSTESGFKYLLYGATTSAVMLYGFSLIYGLTGTTQLYDLAPILFSQVGVPSTILLAVLALILVGFSFKSSVAPFHFWAPDVYEGAPTPVAGFLSTASKAAGFAVLMRFLLVVFGTPAAVEGGVNWVMLLAVLAGLTMIIGNALALAQKNMKRLLAYSSIAHAGYILIGVASAYGSSLGASGATFYLGTYLVTNLAAFGVVTIVGRVMGSDEIACYAGLSRRSPGLALALLAALLSLGGVPPFAGFVGKVFVFASAIQSGMVWLAVLGILNSVLGLYYYLTVLKVVYLYRSDEENHPILVTRPWSIALTVCVAGVILLGTVFGPWYGWAQVAASSLF